MSLIKQPENARNLLALESLSASDRAQVQAYCDSLQSTLDELRVGIDEIIANSTTQQSWALLSAAVLIFGV